MKLEELRVYNLSMDIGQAVWDVVSEWKYFERDTVGKQWVRAADSIAANISEGFGRYHFKENKQFLYYARGSFNETMTWMSKALDRNLLDAATGERIHSYMDNLGPQLNSYIRSIGPGAGHVYEPQAEYYTNQEGHFRFSNLDETE